MRSYISAPVYRALQHLSQRYPDAYRINLYCCEVCGNHYAASFLLPGNNRRFYFCTTCRTFAGNGRRLPEAG